MERYVADKILDVINEAKAKQKDASIEDATDILRKFRPKAIGEMLIDENKITPEQLKEALLEQSTNKGSRVGKILVENETINAEDLLRVLAKQFDLPWIDQIPSADIDPSLVSDLTIGYCKQNLIVPISKDLTGITVAVNDPLNIGAIDDLRLILGTKIYRVICPRSVIEAAINSVFERQDVTRSEKSELTSDDEDTIAGLDDVNDLLHESDEAPVRREVSTILRRAIAERASDVHIEPYEDKMVVRVRIDGRLRDLRTISKKYQSSIITRIKIIGKLNIAESRIPQDGRIALKVGGRECDVRLSMLPTKWGERIVMRILDKSQGIRELPKIGLPDAMYKEFEKILMSEHGIILVTGPTGSGKTSTLASALLHINSPDKNIITVEDPVEYELPGCGQVEVKEEAGLTYATALRSILRQDPDVILIGEIRDTETCQIAVTAAITGHLVFSTLHTNDTAATVTRLNDLGIEPFQITTSLLAVLAVRLMPRLCPVCKEVCNHTEEELDLLSLKPSQVAGKKLYRARLGGCAACKGTGYSGRMPIFELLIVNDDVRAFILRTVDGASLKKMCVQKGMKTLRDNATDRVLQGETSLMDAVTSTQIDDKNITEI